MAEQQNGFVWYELMTTDLPAAQAFYGQVTGWTAAPSPMAPPGMDYRLFSRAEGQYAAGLMTLPEEARAMGVPPHWLGYIGVADVTTSLAKAVKLGASVLVPVTEIPQVGYFAVIRDPQGAAFGLFMPKDQGMEPPAPPAGTPGRVGWHELYTTDWQAGFAFYSEMFGWQKGEAMDMGPMGTYQLFTVGDVAIGGMMNKPPAVPVACWGYYVNVADIDAALAKVNAGGGQVLMGPQQVPGGSWIVQAKDPQGAAFAVVGPRPAA